MIDVKAYKRVIRRHRYQPSCECEHLPRIITAPGPPDAARWLPWNLSFAELAAMAEVPDTS